MHCLFSTSFRRWFCQFYLFFIRLSLRLLITLQPQLFPDSSINYCFTSFHCVQGTLKNSQQNFPIQTGAKRSCLIYSWNIKQLFSPLCFHLVLRSDIFVCNLSVDVQLHRTRATIIKHPRNPPCGFKCDNLCLVYYHDREINDSFQSPAHPTSVNAIVIFPRTHKRKK